MLSDKTDDERVCPVADTVTVAELLSQYAGSAGYIYLCRLGYNSETGRRKSRICTGMTMVHSRQHGQRNEFPAYKE